MAETEVDVEIQRGETSQLSLQGLTARMNEIETVSFLSITSQSPGRVPLNYPSSVNCSCFVWRAGGTSIYSPTRIAHSAGGVRPSKESWGTFTSGKENRTKTMNAYYRE